MTPEGRSVTNGHARERTGVSYYPPDQRSIPQLFRELADEGAELMRQEVALAKAEMNEKLESYRRATLELAAGGVLLIAALLTLLWAVNRGLTMLLAQGMALEVAVWLSPLILTVVVGGVGMALVGAGRKKMADESLTPERTKASMEENARWVRDKARELRLEAKNG